MFDIYHKGIQCDNCNYWYHSECVDVDDNLYHIMGSSNTDWFCPACLDADSNIIVLTKIQVQKRMIVSQVMIHLLTVFLMMSPIDTNIDYVTIRKTHLECVLSTSKCEEESSGCGYTY